MARRALGALRLAGVEDVVAQASRADMVAGARGRAGRSVRAWRRDRVRVVRAGFRACVRGIIVHEPPAWDEAWAGPRRHAGRARGDAKAPIGCILPGVHASGGVQAAAVVVRVLEHRPLVCRVALVKRRLPERRLPSGKLLEVVRTTGDRIRKVEGFAPSTRLKTGSALLDGVAAVG